ncbi:N-acetyltransferase [Pseudoloma neurophilia]|uniref:N-acetyltransferase n=1 Tax=Pseudoloma neurophilia TaxID=146866 RepID=A0A0R0LV77_9MICR|nr:N-acetyltransferase [Pseudoloma neurophilia]
MNVNVRRARITDIPAIFAINQAYIQEKYSQSFLIDLFETSADHFVVEIEEQSVNKNKINNKNESMAEDQQHITRDLIEFPSTTNNQNIEIFNENLRIVGYLLADSFKNEIIQLCIHSEYRRRGLALKLIRAAFIETGVEFFTLFVRVDNKPAYNLYLQKLDGDLISVIPDYYDDSAAFFIKINKKCLKFSI